MSKNKLLLEIIVNFLKRDVKAKYSDSKLSLFWVILKPLILSGITSLVFAVAFKANIQDIPYVLYVMIGFSVWNFFSGSLVNSAQSLIINRGLIINTSLPGDAIVINSILSCGIDFIVGLMLFLIVFIAQGRELDFEGGVLIGMLVVSQTLFQLGLGFINSSLTNEL